jgi:hypothetical protein
MVGMKLRSVSLGVFAVVVTGAALVAMPAAGATAAPHAASPATAKVIAAPVTASGQASSGFTVHKTPKSDVVECNFAEPSPGSISPNVEECSPSAAYAIACWKAATAHEALCMQNASSHKLSEVKLDGKFAATKAASAYDRAPLYLVLTDGTHCSIRDGGAWGFLKSNPHYTGSYSCSDQSNVWAPPKSGHYGVNESAATWTVRTASESDKGPLVTRDVASAYFVATAPTS